MRSEQEVRDRISELKASMTREPVARLVFKLISELKWVLGEERSPRRCNPCKYGPYYCWMIEADCNVMDGYEIHCLHYEETDEE